MPNDITNLAQEWYAEGEYPYWYGTFGQKPAAALLAQKKGQYPKQYAQIQSLGGYAGAVGKYPAVFDCIGFLRALCLYHPAKNSLGSIAFKDYGTKKPADSQFMDISADGACRAWGGNKPIASIPEPTPAKPVAVFMPGHVGLYIGAYQGKKRVIEATPPKLQMSELSNRSASLGRAGKSVWTGWACVPEKWLAWADLCFDEKPAPAPDKPVEGQTEGAEGFKTGGRVRIKQYGVPYYPGCKTKIPDQAWLRDMTLTVAGVEKKGGVPSVLLKEINTWCACENLARENLVKM